VGAGAGAGFGETETAPAAGATGAVFVAVSEDFFGFVVTFLLDADLVDGDCVLAKRLFDALLEAFFETKAV
jgi:hypothetical protein